VAAAQQEAQELQQQLNELEQQQQRDRVENMPRLVNPSEALRSGGMSISPNKSQTVTEHVTFLGQECTAFGPPRAALGRHL
jgi:hypothetical protein